ncbi:pyrroline-5-carboxylate reductase [Weissella uvarum]|uniref:pyrroline-5-carboxylate reductase n=1 Tax=Weissella uvarum TaxID=1479233 RepID=UPI0019604B0B|nr:pyrroline-5-carboxylate reductase [Weissella uvarum]MBM7617026.1 pyrroline-5-carboxylate reductase [Weissella uvarum]MCM0595324.1 pyrroline-5-carboxylate reductase [Weissella uvarum]
MEVGMIGVGHMGQAIVNGLLNKMDGSDLILSNHRLNSAMQNYADKQNVKVVTDNQELVAAKPKFLIFTTPAPITLDVMKEISGLDEETIILSAAGGVKLDDIQEIFPNNPVALLMPNTPVEVNQGTLGVALGNQVKDADEIEAFLQQLGDVFIVPEKQFNIFGTVTGCGPAFVDVFLAALGDAAVKNGLSRDLAYQAAASMVKGSATLMQETKTAPDVLKDQVTTPGGSTIRGVVALEKNAFRSAVIDAIDAANN